MTSSHEQLYLRQLLAGKDFAKEVLGASHMQNFVYLVGDRNAGQCVVVDPAWAIDELVDIAAADGMTLVGALATHYHPDHIGGSLFGHNVEGLAQLMARNPCPVHVHKLERDGVVTVTGLSYNDVVGHESGDVIAVGDVGVELLHTPGHTPGSACFRVAGSLVSGDTLFLQGCGRVDLPGGDVDEMFRTLSQRLSTLPGETVVYPGHAYGGLKADLAALRRDNHYLQIDDLMRFRAAMTR